MKLSETSSPAVAGWYWWRASKNSNPTEIKVSQSDISSGRYSRWGGEWHPFPSFTDVIDYREKCIAAQLSEKKMRAELDLHISVLKRFVDFLIKISGNIFVPKGEIKKFLEGIKDVRKD